MATVLLVEDVDIVRMVLSRMLIKGGHEVIPAGNVAAAMTTVRHGRCDLVVTDIWMPAGDGLSLIESIKTHAPAMPVIAITGGAPRASTEFSLDAARAAGAERVLLKPIAKDELLEAIAALIMPPSSADQ